MPAPIGFRPNATDNIHLEQIKEYLDQQRPDLPPAGDSAAIRYALAIAAAGIEQEQRKEQD